MFIPYPGSEFFPSRILDPKIFHAGFGSATLFFHFFICRKKEFWDVSEAHKLMSDKFKKGLAHEPDGLIFQPSRGQPSFQGCRRLFEKMIYPGPGSHLTPYSGSIS
jgi:mRNA-capping enzyme